jgi:hypothetical protein
MSAVPSQPQLYIEGNHRTGALIELYSRSSGKALLFDCRECQAYFDPSTLSKETKKTTLPFAKLPRLRKQFAVFCMTRGMDTTS